MSKHTIVGDSSSPLIALAVIGQLELLPRLYSRVVIPPDVWEEIMIKGAGLPGALAVSRLTWLNIQTPSSELLKPLSILVDRGEAQAIALALSIPESTVLLDDAQARRVAERFGVSRIGTLGVLRRAILLSTSPILFFLNCSRRPGMFSPCQSNDNAGGEQTERLVSESDDCT